MPTYEFEADDGQRIDRIYAPGRAPKIGRCVQIGGRLYRRVPSQAEFKVQPNFRVATRQLPLWYGFSNQAEADAMVRAKSGGRRLKANHKEHWLQGKMAAERAGKLHEYDEKGRPRAEGIKGVRRTIDTAKRLGDKLDWD